MHTFIENGVVKFEHPFSRHYTFVVRGRTWAASNDDAIRMPLHISFGSFKNDVDALLYWQAQAFL